MTIMLIIDEYTDVEDEESAKKIVGIIIDALHYPHKIRPGGECILGEMTRQ